MNPLSGINTNASLSSILYTPSVNPSYDLLAAELSLSSPTTLFGNSNTFVGISARGQLLSAAVAFQDMMKALRPGTASSGGGQNFGTDFASLAAEAQSFVDTFNTLQNSITRINIDNNQFSGNGADLVNELNTQAQANFDNPSSALTNLSQLGIEFQPALFPGGNSKMSLDLGKLQAAFNADATGSFALLSKVASAFGDTAANFIGQSGSQYSSLNALMQSALGSTLFGNTSQMQTSNSLFSLLGSLPQGGTGWGQAITAMTEYSMVSQLYL
jgi:hypothetical protein